MAAKIIRHTCSQYPYDIGAKINFAKLSTEKSTYNNKRADFISYRICYICTCEIAFSYLHNSRGYFFFLSAAPFHSLSILNVPMNATERVLRVPTSPQFFADYKIVRRIIALFNHRSWNLRGIVHLSIFDTSFSCVRGYVSLPRI